MAIGAVAAGSLTRRLGRSRVLAVCLCWFSVTVAAAAMAPTELLFASGRVLAGFGLGCLLPVASALVLDNAAPARRTLVYGVMFSAYPCGGMVAGIAAGQLGLDGDFRTPLALGALALLAVPAVLRLRDVASVPPDQKDPLRRSGGSAADLFAERGVYRTVLLWMATFMCLLVIYGLYTWLPSIMQATGYGLASAVAFLAILNLGGVVGMLVSGWAADRLGVRVVGGMACLLGGLAIGLLSLRPPTALGYVLVAVAGMSAIGAQV
ncbi:hypothetical protein BJF90_08255 [Pseudonocardia sp. CNS-004]|nr:hypothetical protein BJF90_08255 [Pseudonocardia sp. CNS-004]